MTSVRVSCADAVARVTFARPQRLNALDVTMRRELVDILRTLAGDDGVRAVVLTGEGRAFCVGQDLSHADELERADETVAGTYNPIAQAIADMPQPVIAAVNGPAVGAGLGLVLACDVRIAVTTASFSAAFVKVGLVPDTGVTWHLVRELGYARAFELTTRGLTFSAQDAQDWGLLTELTPPDLIHERATAVARELAAGPALALQLTKRQLRYSMHADLRAVLALEAHNQGVAARHADHGEGRAAFIERRPPQWS